MAAQSARGYALGNPSHGTLYRYADRLFWMPPLYFEELAGAFTLADWLHVGGIDLVTGRAWNVLVGGLTTLALFLFLYRRTGAMAAFLAALFFAADTFVWKAHRTIRFESLLTLLTLLAFLAATSALDREEEGRSSRRAWLALGVVGGMMLNVHPNAILLLLAIAAMAIGRGGWKLLRKGGPWLAIVVALVLFLPYLRYLLTDAATGFANIRGQNSFHLEHGGGLAGAPLSEWRRWADWFVFPARLPAFLAWLALVAAGTAVARRGEAKLAGAALIVFGVFALLLALLPNKTLLYLACGAPFVAIAGAVLWNAPSGRWRQVARGALVLGLLASLVVDAGLLWTYRRDHAAHDLETIRALLRPDDRVAGTFVTWWATQPVSCTEAPRPFHEFSRGATLESVEAFHPSVIILGDRQWQQEVPTRFGALDHDLFAPGGPLDGANPILELSGSGLGDVTVYPYRGARR